MQKFRSFLAIAAFALLSPASLRAQFTSYAWTSDATSGISTDSSWAYHFGAGTAAIIMGQTVPGITGANPSVTNQFSASGPATTTNNLSNNLTSLTGTGSAVVAHDFIGQDAAAYTVTLQGLTVGTCYAATFLSVGWSADSSGRSVTFASGADSLAVNQDKFGSNNGIRVDYAFTATATTRTITITPGGSGNLQLYGLGLRALGTWTRLAHNPPASAGHFLLLTDGTVMAENLGSGYGPGWFRLTPDIHGSYANGTWSTLASMNDTRLDFSSVVLQDGRVFVAGGEYGTGGNTAEIYDPVANTWTRLPGPPTGQAGYLDSDAVLLSNGNVLVSPVQPAISGGTVIYNPALNTISAGAKLYRGSYQDEATWVKLPDDSILTIDPFGTNSERYIPASNTWVNDSTVPVPLYDSFGFELGPGMMLPNGKAIIFGSTGHTGIYTPTGTTNPGSWVAGPDFPNGQGMPDAPCAMMVNGKILCATSPAPSSGNDYPSPTNFYQYDYASNTFTQVSPPNGGASFAGSTWPTLMLALPDGSVLFGHRSTDFYVFRPAGSTLTPGKPVISSITTNPDGSLHLTGNLFNGLCQGASYGDDEQMDTNFPIVRFTDAGGNVRYGRTYNWSSTGVMTGAKVVSTDCTIPSGASPSDTIQVVANGIASDIGPDTTPPTPNPMTFAQAPTALSSKMITMTASTASDISGVQYYFTCTAGGGHDSGWQSSLTYTDTGLTPSTLYTYTVTARDNSQNQNQTAPSSGASATTGAPDYTPPTIVSLSPAKSAINVPVTSALTINFNKGIIAESGSVTLNNLTDATQTAIDIHDPQVTITGSTLTINLTSELHSRKTYAVQIAPTAIQDYSGNSFAGITDNTTWTFSTAVVPFVWTQTSGGAQAWNTAGNWQAGYAADPVTGDTVDFSSVDLAANTNLTLDSDRTAQLWIFGDASSTQTWTVNAGNSMILAGNTPTIQVNNSSATLNNVVAGTAGLTKTGTGTLVLGSTNTYTGDTTISGGILQIGADGNLGASSGGITFGGAAALQSSTLALTVSSSRTITVNAGATAIFQAQHVNNTGKQFNFTGKITGSGGIQAFDDYTLGQYTVNLTATTNDFTGSIGIGNLTTQGGQVTLNIASLQDGVGYGNVIFGYVGTAPTFNYTGSSPLNLNNRQIELASSKGGNLSSGGVGVITVAKDLLVSGTGIQTFTLSGSNTGSNTFAGNIANGTSALNLNKTGAGKWCLGGTNTYTGTTQVQAGGGTLVFQGLQALPASSTITLFQNSSATSAIKLLTDNPGKTTLPNTLVIDHKNALLGINITVGNNNTTSGGTTTGSTVALAKLTFTDLNNGQGLVGIGSINSPNGYRLQFNGVDLPAFTTAFTTLTSWTARLTPTTANLTLAGNIQQLAGTTDSIGTVPTLGLDGTSSMNLISGNIADAADLSTNNKARPLNIAKTNSSTWTLSGTNTYTGTTTVSAGTLLINGDSSAASGGVNVSSGATLGGSGIIGGNTLIASGGKLLFDLSNTTPGSHTPLSMVSGKTFAFSGSSTLTITSSGVATAGLYTLVSAPGGITGSVPATVNLPAGWTASAPQISGNALVINVTSTGYGPGPVDHFVISAISSTQTLGVPITGITINAQDASNATATSFTGTVTFGGTGGFAGSSANFTAGVLTGVSVTPTVAGSSLTLTVSDGFGHTGSASIATVQTQYTAWSGGAAFNADSNGDGIANGLAYIFGASSLSASTIGLLPTFDTSSDPAYLIYTFRRSQAANNDGSTSFAVQYGSDLNGWTTAVDDGTNIIITATTDGAGAGIDLVQFKIKRTLAASGKLFMRIKAMAAPTN